VSKLTTNNGPSLSDDFMASMENTHNELNHFIDNHNILNRNKDRFIPVIDITETSSGYNVEIEAPGMKEKDVDIEILDNILVIQGDKKIDSEENEKGVLKKERSCGFFYREIPFIHEVSSEDINIKVEDGVYKLKIKKKAGLSQYGHKVILT
jgi:HSP20 family protein